MHRNRLGLGFGLVGSLALVLVACGGAGQVGEAVRPKAATAHEAMGEGHVDACAKAVAGEPLVVDLKSNERSDLEVAMKDGVVVVGFDCKSLKIVKGCSAPGSYRFAGVTRKEDVVRMQNQDEMAANLPLTGASMSASMKRGSTLDLALVTVGKRRTTASELTKGDLQGTCEGVTHVVRGVYVGAFALATGSEGEARAVAQIFGAGGSGASASGRKTEARDGDLEECRKATADASEPPNGCAAITRLELVPIVTEKTDREVAETKKKEGGDDPLQVSCSNGFDWDGTKCVKAGTSKIARACDRETGTKDECQKGCDGGNAESCYNLALYATEEPKKIATIDGTSKMVRYANPKPDVAIVEKACSLGYAAACSRAGYIYQSRAYGTKVEAEKKDAFARAAKLMTSACDLGEAQSCSSLAYYFDPTSMDQPGFAKSADKSVAYVRRACDLGLGASCGRLGDMHRDGKGLREDSKLAIAAYERQCSAGAFLDGDGCYKIGAIYANGKGIATDKTKALGYFERACTLRNMAACMAGVQLANEAKDTSKARTLLERGCNKDVRGWDPCLMLGEAYEKGNYGLQKDYGKAAEAYELGCAKGGCQKAGDLYKSGGPGLPASPEKALHAYTTACTQTNDTKACSAQEAIAKIKGKDELVKLYKYRCENRSEGRSCLKLKALGVTPSEPGLKSATSNAEWGCKNAHYGDECKVWKDLGGSPSAAELAQPTREATLKKQQEAQAKTAATTAKK